VQAFFERTDCYPPVVGHEHRIEVQLAQIGVEPQDIGRVILSHMHSDHTGFLKQVRHAPVWVQRREYDYAHSPGIPGSYQPPDYQDLDLDWRIVDGDWEVMPGLSMIDTRGHTEGHQSAIIDLPRTGPVVLPFDAGDLQENFDEEILPGSTCDDAAALAAIRRVKAVVAERQAKMILFHDPLAIQQTRLAPDFYD
jgi:N-acyl homoserine lactone hydrolase